MDQKKKDIEANLAELLKEVRALHTEIDLLKLSPEPSGVGSRKLPPNYAVLVKSAPDFPDGYAVLVKPDVTLPPDYGVLVKAGVELPPDYAVLVKPGKDLPSGYAVLVKPGPDFPNDYGVLVKPAPESEEILFDSVERRTK